MIKSKKTGEADNVEKKKKPKSTVNKYIFGVMYLFVALFVGLAGYLCYFTVKKAPDIVNSPYNGRLDKLNQTCIRGNILARDGQILATSELDKDDNETRKYPLGESFAHVVGYTSVGETGIESAAGYYLLNSHESYWSKIYKELTDHKITGDTVYTTLDVDLQKLIYDQMKDKIGACVVMDSKTGEVLAMVSTPSFNPNTLEKDYSSLVSDSEKSNLLNRCTQGLYCPGSTFKILTALEYIKENPDDWEDYSYRCNGSITIDGKTVRCSHGNVHGTVDIKQSMAHSCNSSFINMGMSLNIKSFKKLCERFLFNEKIQTLLPVAESRFYLNSDSSEWEVMQTSFGQGSTLITPLHNAMILSSIENNGIMVKPKFLKSVENTDGDVVESFENENIGSVMSANEADILKDMLSDVVSEGTADILKTSKYDVIAKTGSAQTKKDKETNAWMVAGASNSKKNYVVSIVLEEGGAGSEAAGPIVKKIFDSLLAD